MTRSVGNVSVGRVMFRISAAVPTRSCQKSYVFIDQRLSTLPSIFKTEVQIKNTAQMLCK